MQSYLVILGLATWALAKPSNMDALILSRRDSCSTPDGSGTCGSTSSCGGFSVAGYCPGSSDIQCCVSQSCSNSDGSGTCMSTSSSCSGSFVAGLCPGDSSIQCCMSSSSGSGGGSGSSSGSGSAVVEAAKSQLGVPYVWGGGGCDGVSDGGFDCSGLTQYSICQAYGVTIPRTAQDQYDATDQGAQIPVSEIQAGDLVFWGEGGDCSSQVEHTAVVESADEIIAAPSTGDVVKDEGLWHSSDGLELCSYAMRFS